MEKVRLLFMFDYLNYDEDKEWIEDMLKGTDIDYTVQEIPRIHEGGLDAYTHILFDFGALFISGASGLAESLLRKFGELADNYSEVRFVIIATIGTEFYRDITNRSNVYALDRSEMQDLVHYIDNQIGVFQP